MIKSIAIVAVLALAALLAYAATRPDTFHVERRTRVEAKAEKIYPLIADLHAWRAWSPYETKDPAMKRSLGGAASGKGASYAWEGNKEVGQGRMEITDTAAPSKVTIQLDFVKPFEAHNVVNFHLEPSGDATEVAWVMDGPAPFVSKLMGIFFDMDKMIGTDFEAGLAKLKSIAEQQALGMQGARLDSRP